MRFLLVLLFLHFNILAVELKKTEFNVASHKISIKQKKARFYAFVQPAVHKVYTELLKQHNNIARDMKIKKNKNQIQKLKKEYKVNSDEKLLLALKPHPPSITLAQAAIESSWATSRFFYKAKNVFGIWSINPNEPRIAANEKRSGGKTIWLKKFNSIEDSVRAYYKLIGRAKAYKDFRKLRYKTKDPFKIISKLDKYSEMGTKYTNALEKIIRYNKLQKFDINR